jgi:hypothetical protein
MLRSALIASLMLAGSSVVAAGEERRPADARQTQGEDQAAAPIVRRDGFVITSDACGASRYAHLVGREYAQVYQAALLPADSLVQNRSMWRTLEYTPHQLNVVVGAEGRIIAIGCF